MWHSLRFRLLLALIAVVVVVVGTVTVLASRTTMREFQRYVERGSVLRDRRLQGMLAVHYQQNGNWNNVQPLVEQMAKTSGERIVLADENGLVLADSDHKLIGQSVSPGTVGPGVMITWSDVPVGFLYVQPTPGLPPDSPEAIFLGSVNRWLLTGVIAAAVVAIILTAALSRRILRPVEALTEAARRMEKGDLSQRVAVQTKDEIGELAHAFNSMSDGLARLEQLRRNMVTDVAHELRTPLSNIRGYLEALQDGVTQPSPEVIGSLHDEAMLLTRLVNDLQELALAEAGQLKLVLQPTAVEQIVSQVVSVMQPTAASKGLTLQTDLQHGLPPVMADAGRVAQVLQNLANNAMSCTPAGGTITVTARLGASAAEVQLSVRDTGIGIAPEHLPYVFDRFYRVDQSRTRATGGAGLGLTIVKQLVEAHGSHVWAESTLGQGSTFAFTLPVAPSAEQPGTPPGRNES
jgi:signal transduction histidine kinase